MEKKTGRLIYADSVQCADLWYETGFRAGDPFLWFSVDGEATVIMNELEIGRALKQCRAGVKVMTLKEALQTWGSPEGTTYSELLCAVAAKAGVETWAVPETFPLGFAKRLEDKNLRLAVQEPFCPERAVKREEEVEWLREGVQLAEAGLYRAWEVLRESTIGDDGYVHWRGTVLTAEALRGEIDAEMSRRGGTGEGTICAPGPQGADPHQAGHGPIPANVPIVMDIFPRCNRTGYFGDLTRTVVKGHATDVVQRAFEAVKEAQKTVLGMLKAGVQGQDAHQEVFRVYERHGFPTDLEARPPRGYFHGTGHGLGLAVHEAPSISRRDCILQAGNVVTVEPGLYYPEWGGIRLEDVAVIRENGCEDLTTAPIFLELELT